MNWCSMYKRCEETIDQLLLMESNKAEKKFENLNTNSTSESNSNKMELVFFFQAKSKVLLDGLQLYTDSESDSILPSLRIQIILLLKYEFIYICDALPKS